MKRFPTFFLLLPAFLSYSCIVQPDQPEDQNRTEPSVVPVKYVEPAAPPPKKKPAEPPKPAEVKINPMTGCVPFSIRDTTKARVIFFHSCWFYKILIVAAQTSDDAEESATQVFDTIEELFGPMPDLEVLHNDFKEFDGEVYPIVVMGIKLSVEV